MTISTLWKGEGEGEGEGDCGVKIGVSFNFNMYPFIYTEYVILCNSLALYLIILMHD